MGTENRQNKKTPAGEPIILASTSPRRKEILEQLHIPFFSIAPPCDEKIPASNKEIPAGITCLIGIKKRAEYLAILKALSTAKAIEDGYCDIQKARLIVAADTLIVFRRKIYEKPKTKEEALSFLSIFSGKTHKVYTGIAVYNRETQTYISCTSVSRVRFARLSEEEKERYIESNEWCDAAGAYKIQGTAQRFIKRIAGSYSSIMGLPIFEFYEILKKSGYRF